MPAASTITAANMQTFLDGPFAQQFTGANWAANWSSASSTNTTSEIAPGQTIETSTNANEPGFQDLAEGYAMLATFGGSNLSASAMQAVVSTAMSLISQGNTALHGDGVAARRRTGADHAGQRRHELADDDC